MYFDNNRFSNKVANNVSTLQDIEIMALFSSELFCFIGFLEQSNTTGKSSKRRKLDDTDAKAMRMVEPLILLMCRFLRALRINVSYKDELEKEFQTMFDRFIYPIF